MTGDKDQARLIAERIARRVAPGSGASAPLERPAGHDMAAELSAMRASLDDMRLKLVQLESRLAHGDNRTASYSDGADRQNGISWKSTGAFQSTSGPQHFSSTYAPALHPSQERFGVEEATVSELVDFFEGDKKCEIEPGGKPCDHCAMCSSRGF